MIETGDAAPDLTLPIARGETYDDVGEFRLSEAAEEGPVVLAFIPAAFTSGCTEEMCTFRDSIAAFEDIDAQVYGVSVDLPPSQNIFIQEHGLTFPMLSDFNQEAIESFGVVRDEIYGAADVAKRSIFVIDDGTVVYRWIRPDEGRPDYPELIERVARKVDELAR